MKSYRVAVSETYRRVVIVTAHTEREAHDRVMDAWLNGEVLLEESDFEGTEVYVFNNSDTEENDLMHIEAKGAGWVVRE